MATRMQRILAGMRAIVPVLGIAVVLTCLSSYVERIGPEVAAYGYLCGPTTSGPCNEPVLKGGFPVAYLFDMPGVSVEHQLSFGEDIFDVKGWLIDAAIYAAMSTVVRRAIVRRRSASRPTAP